MYHYGFWPHYVAEDVLELKILLLPPHKCWDEVMYHLAWFYIVVWIRPRASYMLGKHLATGLHFYTLISTFALLRMEFRASYKASTWLTELHPQPSSTFIVFFHLEFSCGYFHLFSKSLIFNRAIFSYHSLFSYILKL